MPDQPEATHEDLHGLLHAAQQWALDDPYAAAAIEIGHQAARSVCASAGAIDWSEEMTPEVKLAAKVAAYLATHQVALEQFTTVEYECLDPTHDHSKD